jgi:hypothetical protein
MLALEWRLARAPRGSQARLRGTMSGLASLLSLRKSSTGSGHPMLTPDKPGTYVVRLTVSDGRRSRADSVNVSALFPSASVPIDTAVDGVAPNGTKMQGIAIGYHPAAHNYREPRGPEQFYPARATSTTRSRRPTVRSSRRTRPGLAFPGFRPERRGSEWPGERSMPATMPALTASWRRMIRITTTTSPGPGPRSTSAPTAPRRSR